MDVNTIQKLSPEKCTGCGACVNRCPTTAIGMEPDMEGFLHPVVDDAQCIGCSNCVSACPVLTPISLSIEDKEPDCYAAWSQNEHIRFQSTSGGIFTHLAQAILGQGGYVVGARYRENHLVEHSMIDSEDGIASLRQSKYVQSDIGLVYREVEEKLKQGIPVLFAGTPCQCAGLQAFLGRGYENLYLCDFICRGVVSPKAYQRYLRVLEEKYGDKVQRVWFKNKEVGWNHFRTRIDFKNGAVYSKDRYHDCYMQDYLKNNRNIRLSCYTCFFKGISRPTDITMADFWGFKTDKSSDDIEKGVSLLLIHTKKGKMLFDTTKNKLCFRPALLEDALVHNICAIESVKMIGTLPRDKP